MTRELAGVIDHTLLAPTATADDVRAAAAEVQEYGFYSLCVASRWAPLARQVLGESRLCCVVGFPHGNASKAAKAAESTQAVADGAVELDMVIDLGAARAGDLKAVEADVAAVVGAAGAFPVKAILETAYFDDPSMIAELSRAAVAGGAAFVKTSTGFGPGGATLQAVRSMRAAVGADIGVKASGGVRTAEDVARYLEAGATRIGASQSIAIVSGSAAKADGY
ncbi:MAG: deoxyribose-phosphate aldolase [Myxococcota bacterium]